MASHTVDNPFTGETACTVPMADEAAIGKVLDRAREAARALRKLSVEERVALCDRALTAFEASAEDVAKDITRQMGKPLSQARGEVKGMAGRWRHMMEIAKESLADIVLPAEGRLRASHREGAARRRARSARRGTTRCSPPSTRSFPRCSRATPWS